MNIIIRRAGPQEAESLRSLARCAKQFWGYSREYMQRWNHLDSLSPEFIETNPVYCAVQPKELAGFYALVMAEDEAELKHLWVSPDQIGTGSRIGSRLFGHALRTASSKGAVRMRINSEPNAEGFYVRMGAEHVDDVYIDSVGHYFKVFEISIL